MAYEMKLDWIKCQGDQWCKLLTVNLAHAHFSNLHGVYVIWHGGKNASTVYVGQGLVAERLVAHKQDPDILQYSPLGLFVTWAQLAHGREGVERYLGEVLKPKVSIRFPDVQPMQVNLPW